MDTGTTLSVDIAGATYEARVPATFADREDIVRAWKAAEGSVRRSRAAFALAVVLCAPALRQRAGVPELDAFDGEVLAYGATAYEALRALGAKQAEISDAALALWPLVVAALYPRAAETEKTEDFSAAGA